MECLADIQASDGVESPKRRHFGFIFCCARSRAGVGAQEGAPSRCCHRPQLSLLQNRSQQTALPPVSDTAGERRAFLLRRCHPQAPGAAFTEGGLQAAWCVPRSRVCCSWSCPLAVRGLWRAGSDSRQGEGHRRKRKSRGRRRCGWRGPRECHGGQPAPSRKQARVLAVWGCLVFWRRPCGVRGRGGGRQGRRPRGVAGEPFCSPL